MASFERRNDCSVSAQDLDDQHKILFALVNEYYETVSRNMNAENAEHILRGLMSFAHAHFRDEENLMLRHDYPGFAAQRAEHDRFSAIIGDYLKRADEGRPAPPDEIMDFIRSKIL